MAKTNSNTTLESLVSTLVATHVDSLLGDLVAGSSRPIGEFALDGASVFVVYGATGAPLGYGGSGSISSAASRNQTRRLVNQLAATGIVTTYRTVPVASDRLVDVVGRMIGGLLGSSVLKIGDGIANGPGESATLAAARRGRPAGRMAGAKGGRKGRGGHPRTGAVADVEQEETTEAPRRRGRQAGSRNSSKAGASKRGPGRPRSVESSETEAPVRRGPGRPKRSEVADSAAAAPVTRKRGRPAKSTEGGEATAPKRRGRPPGSKSKSPAKGGRQRKSTPASETSKDTE